MVVRPSFPVQHVLLEETEDGLHRGVVTAGDAGAGEVLDAATLEAPGVPEVPSEVVTPTWTPVLGFEKKVIEVKDSKGTVIKDGKALQGSTIHQHRRY